MQLLKRDKGITLSVRDFMFWTNLLLPFLVISYDVQIAVHHANLFSVIVSGV